MYIGARHNKVRFGAL